MHAPTRPLTIEGYTIDVPETVKPEYQRAYAAYFLHTFLGTTEMTKHAPKLHDEFYGPNRNPVETQKIWRTVGHQAHEDAQRLFEQRTISHPKTLVDVMTATEEAPEFIEAFRRIRQPA